MKTIGLVVATEIKAVLSRLGDDLTHLTESGFHVYFGKVRLKKEECRLVIVHCGCGEIAAAGATQFLISKYDASVIMNFGLAGGLSEEMSKAKLCLVEKVVHYDFDTSKLDHIEKARYIEYPDCYIPVSEELLEAAAKVAPELPFVICASGDKFVDEPEAKHALCQAYGASICEMEAAGILLTCNRNHVPCLLVKIVSDSLFGGHREYQETFAKASLECLHQLLHIIENIHF